MGASVKLAMERGLGSVARKQDLRPPHLLLGIVQASVGTVPRALDLAQRAYAAAPGYPEISDTYGWILVRMDRITEGLPVLEQALAKAPANPDVQYHAAFAYVKTGQPQRAAELLRKALATSQPFASREAAERLLKSVASASG